MVAILRYHIPRRFVTRSQRFRTVGAKPQEDPHWAMSLGSASPLQRPSQSLRKWLLSGQRSPVASSHGGGDGLTGQVCRRSSAQQASIRRMSQSRDGLNPQTPPNTHRISVKGGHEDCFHARNRSPRSRSMERHPLAIGHLSRVTKISYRCASTLAPSSGDAYRGLSSNSWSAIHAEAVALGSWPPDLLVRGMVSLRSFSEAEEAIEVLSTQVALHDHPTITLAILTATDRICGHMAGAHLLPALTDLILLTLRKMAPDPAEVFVESREQRLIQDLLTVFAFRLVGYADPRARDSAIAILWWTSKNHFEGLFSMLVAIFCGLPFTHGNVLDIGYTASIPFHAGHSYYSRSFFDESMWQPLTPLLSEVQEHRDVMVMLAALIKSAHKMGAYPQADSYFALATELHGDGNDSAPSWHAVAASYFATVISHLSNDGSTIKALIDACNRHCVTEASEGDLTLWETVFHHGGLNCTIPARSLVQTLLRRIGSKAPLFASRYHFTSGPPPSLLTVSTLYEALASGLSRRRQEEDLVPSLVTIWQEQQDRNIPGTHSTLASMLRTAVEGHNWKDALLILHCCCMNKSEFVAVKKLERTLRRQGFSISTAGPEMCALISWHTTAVCSESKSAFRLSAFRYLLATSHAMQRQTASEVNPAYEIWTLLPDITAAKPCVESIEYLLLSALRENQDATRFPERPAKQWDGLPATVQTRQIFRELLFSHHPGLAKGEVFDTLYQSISVHETWRSYPWLVSARWEHSIDRYSTSRSSRRLVTNHLQAAASDTDSVVCSIAFSPRSFELYIQLLISIRFLKKFEADEPWQEPLLILAWMRHLGLHPTKQTLCDVALVIRNWGASHTAHEKQKEGSIHILGPLQKWCEEWIPEEDIPSESDVWHRRRLLLHPVWQSGAAPQDR
ncbi:unnamed protein product [Sympodiomycopsis kandeliae]